VVELPLTEELELEELEKGRGKKRQRLYFERVAWSSE